MSEYFAIRRFLHNHDNIPTDMTEGSPKPAHAVLLFRMTSRILYSAQNYRQHCTLHTFEQFGALYIHHHDNKYLAQPGFELGTSRLQAPIDTNPQLQVGRQFNWITWRLNG